MTHPEGILALSSHAVKVDADALLHFGRNIHTVEAPEVRPASLAIGRTERSAQTTMTSSGYRLIASVLERSIPLR